MSFVKQCPFGSFKTQNVKLMANTYGEFPLVVALVLKTILLPLVTEVKASLRKSTVILTHWSSDTTGPVNLGHHQGSFCE